jgi:hypothetical protein
MDYPAEILDFFSEIPEMEALYKVNWSGVKDALLISDNPAGPFDILKKKTLTFQISSLPNTRVKLVKVGELGRSIYFYIVSLKDQSYYSESYILTLDELLEYLSGVLG